MRWLFQLVLALALVATTARGYEPPQATRIELKLPARYGKTDMTMPLLVYRPAGPGPFPVVVYSHGRASAQELRSQLPGIAPQHAAFWLTRGYAVISPVRPGYAGTADIDPERTELRWRPNVGCVTDPDYRPALDNAVWATRQAIDWVQRQPWLRRNHILLEGGSVGGMTSLVAGAENLPGVVGIINFAGGMGGFPEKFPRQSCGVERVSEIFATLGTKSKKPSLWIYAANDQYWGADAPKTWFAAFKKAGGNGTMIITPPVGGENGHLIIPYGPAYWTKPVDSFLRQLPK